MAFAPTKAPSMQRSRTQLAAAYAPHRPFVFEGGEGTCITVPNENNPAANLNAFTKRMIAEQIQEYFEAWFGRATQGEGLRHGVDPALAVEPTVIRGGAVHVPLGDLMFQTPRLVGYVPFPLSFACKRCGLHRDCKSPGDTARNIHRFREACPTGTAGCADDWQQVDVVMTHWSGSVEGVSPVYRHWPREGGGIQEIRTCSSCGGDSFFLRRPPGPLAGWHFVCTSCRSVRKILQRDRDTLRLLGPLMAEDPSRASQAEVNMEPISLRASALHYTHGDSLLVFEEDKWLSLLGETRMGELGGLLATRFGYPAAMLSDARRREILVGAARGDQWKNYEATRAGLSMIEKLPNPDPEMLEGMRRQIQSIEASWNATVFAGLQQTAQGIENAVQNRRDWVRRYDPLRMVVEHKTLEEERLRKGIVGNARLASVDVRVLDPFLTPDGLRPHAKDAMLAEVSRRLDMLGIAEMRLVRDVRICEYTFGYSRTESVPTVQRPTKLPGGIMPVRLRLHRRVRMGDGAAHPVLCVEQSNEGIYVRLDEATVLSWLEANGIALPGAPDGVRLGGRLIEEYARLQENSSTRFTRFLDEYKRERAIPRTAYPMVFTLLHTMAHHLVTVASAMSGLDLGSFGEHLFVPDLAFMIYRRGTTMDLGNLSSMWRERGHPLFGNEVLDRMVSRSSLRCGSETVCSHRGGACPDCILIPENACITRNELLSRSVLIGRGTPKWDAGGAHMVGYFDVAAGRVPDIKPP